MDTFRPARFVARINTAAFTPKTVKVTMTKNGLQYGILAADGTLTNIYDNRPAVRSAFEEVRATSDQLGLDERAKESSHCRNNIITCNEGVTAYQEAVKDWKTALGAEAFVQVREHESGYLYGTFDMPRAGSKPAWATFQILIDEDAPEGMWTTKIDNIILAFMPLEKVQPKPTEIKMPGILVASHNKPGDGDDDNGHNIDTLPGVKPIETDGNGENNHVLSPGELEGADMELLPKKMVPEPAVA